MKQSTIEIDLNEDAVYVVKNEDLIKLTKPESGFGKQVVTWQNGKIAHREVSFTEK